MSKKIGAVAVIGGGIAGMQSALDLANSGFKVCLIEKEPSIGGRMAQLDKTFPTLDCSMCILGPKLVEVSRHRNIDILTLSTVASLEGEPGDFRLTVRKRPRYVDETRCTGCGICQEKCPVKIPDPYNMSMAITKSIRIPYPQAVPRVAVLEPERCLYLTKGRCGLCSKVCGLGAVDYTQEEEMRTLHVGAVIVATGFDPFDPHELPELRYDHPNVITSLEFERLLCASGPTGGHVERPSDGATPKRIGFIQCVGSRDVRLDRAKCSSVCCMQTTKEAVLAKEHEPGVEATIFYMDLRAFGKGFEEFYRRAEEELGVRYVRSRVPEIKPRDDGTLVLRYEDLNTGRIESAEMDMVVLGIGLDPRKRVMDLSERLHLDLDRYGYLRTSLDRPLETNVPGVFVGGVSESPKDIPDTVAQASGAASKAIALLSEARDQLVERETFPGERADIDTPRIGVFVCHCGTNISGVVDVTAVTEYVRTLPKVVYAAETRYACSSDQQEVIQKTIEEHGLTRVVIASCTPRTHEALFQDTIRQAGLNPYLFELANIREHCSWVHRDKKEEATEKAKATVRASVARAAKLRPLSVQTLPVVQRALVIGGGVAGLSTALDIADQGFDVYLVERQDHLGGWLGHIRELHSGQDGREVIADLIERVEHHPRIRVFLGAEVSEVSGSVGDFRARVGNEELSIGAIVMATGADVFVPEGYYGYGELKKVITQREFEDRFDALSPRTTVMIQCAGSREKEPPRRYCSRICCIEAMKNAVRLKRRDPDAQVFILYRDIRTYGLWETAYREARDLGVVFVRFEEDTPPEIDGEGRITVHDTFLGKTLRIDPGLVVLSTPLVPHGDQGELAQMLRVPLDERGFFLEAHVKLRPVDFATEGLFSCGICHFPKLTDEALAQANAVAARVGVILSKTEIESIPTISEVNEALCRGCAFCVEVCPYDAVELVTKKQRSGLEVTVASVNAALCKGCGSCAAACLSGAMQQRGFTDEQLLATIDGMIGG